MIGPSCFSPASEPSSDIVFGKKGRVFEFLEFHVTICLDVVNLK